MKKVTEIDVKIGQNIVFYRTASGLNRKGLALHLGITHQQLQKYEKGINRISVSRLLDISSILKVNVLKFLEFNDFSILRYNEKDLKPVMDIMKYLSKIKDHNKLDAIKNITKSMLLADFSEVI